MQDISIRSVSLCESDIRKYVLVHGVQSRLGALHLHQWTSHSSQAVCNKKEYSLKWVAQKKLQGSQIKSYSCCHWHELGLGFWRNSMLSRPAIPTYDLFKIQNCSKLHALSRYSAFSSLIQERSVRTSPMRIRTIIQFKQKQLIWFHIREIIPSMSLFIGKQIRSRKTILIINRSKFIQLRQLVHSNHEILGSFIWSH